MDSTGLLTLGIALLGAVLGVFNTVTAYRRGARRVRVWCGFGRIDRSNRKAFGLEVVNTGAVPLHVSSIRFHMRSDNGSGVVPLFGNIELENKMVGRLETGARVHMTCPEDWLKFIAYLQQVDVTTACGLRRSLKGRKLAEAKAAVAAHLAEVAQAAAVKEKGGTV